MMCAKRAILNTLCNHVKVYLKIAKHGCRTCILYVRVYRTQEFVVLIVYSLCGAAFSLASWNDIPGEINKNSIKLTVENQFAFSCIEYYHLFWVQLFYFQSFLIDMFFSESFCMT